VGRETLFIANHPSRQTSEAHFLTLDWTASQFLDQRNRSATSASFSLNKIIFETYVSHAAVPTCDSPHRAKDFARLGGVTVAEEEDLQDRGLVQVWPSHRPHFRELAL
jgi:hypothetical protein